MYKDHVLCIWKSAEALSYQVLIFFLNLLTIAIPILHEKLIIRETLLQVLLHGVKAQIIYEKRKSYYISPIEKGETTTMSLISP